MVPEQRNSTFLAARVVMAMFVTAVLLPVPVKAQESFNNTALTRDDAAIQGEVIASGIRWQCDGARCRVSGPWPVPGVLACRALAQKIGYIKAYGHPGASLSPAQLVECNGSSANSGTPGITQAIIDKIDTSQIPLDGKTGPLTPGPIEGPQAESLPDTPMAVLETPRARGRVETARQTWFCDGTRCTIPGQDEPLSGRYSVDHCSRLAQAAGPIVWYTDGRRVFDAEQLAGCNSPYVLTYEVFACGGNDDLRDASHLTIGVYLKDRDFTDSNYRRIMRYGIKPNSCRFDAIDPPNFRLSELGAIYIRHQSYDSGPFQGHDDWPMTRFMVLVVVSEPGGREGFVKVVDVSGSPLHHFQEGRVMWHVDVNP